MHFCLLFSMLFAGGLTAAVTDGHSSIAAADSVATTLYIFTGSDWCPNCKALDKNVLSDSAFIRAMADNKVSIEIVDFPQRNKITPEQRKYNEAIAAQLGFEGVFPSLVMVRNDTGAQRLVNYRNEPAAAFIQTLLQARDELCN